MEYGMMECLSTDQISEYLRSGYPVPGTRYIELRVAGRV